jgi:hypothetical protein
LPQFEFASSGISLASQVLEMRPKSLQFRILFCLLWLAGAGWGFSVLAKYQGTQGAVGTTPAQWPAGTQITLNPKQDTLIMFAHPQCPCTRASIEELNRLLGKADGKLVAHVYFFSPRDHQSDWVKTDLWRSAAAIPGVSVHEDVDGREARLFGAETSGYVLVYDTYGQLLFNGGITESRGHAGENAGENTIVALVSGQATSLKQTPTFGCSLMGECSVAKPSVK